MTEVFHTLQVRHTQCAYCEVSFFTDKDEKYAKGFARALPNTFDLT